MPPGTGQQRYPRKVRFDDLWHGLEHFGALKRPWVIASTVPHATPIPWQRLSRKHASGLTSNTRNPSAWVSFTDPPSVAGGGNHNHAVTYIGCPSSPPLFIWGIASMKNEHITMILLPSIILISFLSSTDPVRRIRHKVPSNCLIYWPQTPTNSAMLP